MEAFTKVAGEVGLPIVATESYGKSDVDFNAQLTNINSKSPDVMMIPDYYNNAYLIATQAKRIGLNATLLGIDGTDGILEIEGADVSVFDNLYFANHYSTEDTSSVLQEFLKDYQAAYNTVPNALGALGYDAAMVMFNAFKVIDGNGVKIAADATTREALIKAMKNTDLQCVTGHITFDENNNPIKNCAIIKVVYNAAAGEASYKFYMSY